MGVQGISVAPGLYILDIVALFITGPNDCLLICESVTLAHSVRIRMVRILARPFRLDQGQV